jgi:hypothetical protein
MRIFTFILLICSGIFLVGYNISAYYNQFEAPPSFQGDVVAYLENFVSFNFLALLGIVIIFLSFQIRRRWLDM